MRWHTTGNGILVNARNLSNALLDVVYPPTCTLCGGDFQRETGIELCPECVSMLFDPQSAWCWRCGLSIRTPGNSLEPCQQCKQQSLPYDQVTLLGRYQGALREAVIAGKQSRHEALAIAIAHLLAMNLAAQVSPLPDWVTFVPSPLRRRLTRGTIPSATLARQVARVLKRPMRSTLYCVRSTAKQATLEMAQRANNVRGAFGVRKPHRLLKRRILVVDDVMTTGATFKEVARTLRHGGAAWIGVAAVARGQSDGTVTEL